MGLMQRRKGRAFEQRIARILRSRWPDAVVRRASQADRAHQSDVYIGGGATVLGRLWMECQDARDPTPLAKLEQAERDASAFRERCGGARNAWRYPVVIWHRIGSREINLTTRLWVIDGVRARLTVESVRGGREVVTMRLEQFLDLLPQSKEAA